MAPLPHWQSDSHHSRGKSSDAWPRPDAAECSELSRRELTNNKNLWTNVMKRHGYRYILYKKIYIYNVGDHSQQTKVYERMFMVYR